MTSHGCFFSLTGVPWWHTSFTFNHHVMKTVSEWLQKKLGDQPPSSSTPHLAQSATGSTPPPPRTGDQGFDNAHPRGKPPRSFVPQQRPAPRPPMGNGPNIRPQQQPQQNQPRGRGGLKLYPLGGFEQVGRNCFVIDVDGDLYIIDLGLQFPDEDMLGIDYLVPDISPLKGKENRIKALLFTHGHLDHIGAVQHLLPQLHFPPMFGTKLTMAFVRKRLDETHITSKARLNNVNYGQKIRIGRVEVEFLRVTHSIPDSASIAVHTPYGTILHTGDFKFDLTPMNEPAADFQRFAQLGEKGVLAIVADSTNATKPGNSKSEKEISETLHGLIRDAKGRIIISTGSQGEEMAGLARIGLGTHRHISIKAGDTVILSSNPIIGNERAVSKVINNLHLKGAIVKTNADLALHTTGHGQQGDILLMHQLVRAKHIIPEHGEPYMCAAHADLARRLGYEENRIHSLVNGDILEFDQQGNARKSKQKFLIQDVIIDGLGSAGEGQRVLNDRKVMSSAGVIIVMLRAYAQSKRLVGDPDIISRGLIYGSEQVVITKNASDVVRKAYDEAVARGETDRKAIKRAISGALYRYFDRKLDREPMIIPIIVEV